MYLRNLINASIDTFIDTKPINSMFDDQYNFKNNQLPNLMISDSVISFFVIFAIIFIALLLKIIIEPNDGIMLFIVMFLFVLIMTCFEFIFILD